MNRIDRKKQVGIDRLIRLEWLEKTARLMLAGNNPEMIKKTLEVELVPYFKSSSPKKRGSLSKTVTILMKTWVKVPQDCVKFRDIGIRLLATHPIGESLPIHWGMIMAAYPFWGAVAEQTGRLLHLQETIAAAQVQRRLREQYGERETVSRRVRYVLRAFIDWRVLKEKSEKGLYSKGKAQNVSDPTLIAWLLEASLIASGKATISLKALLNSRTLFPLKLENISGSHIAQSSSRLEIISKDLNDFIVTLH